MYIVHKIESTKHFPYSLTYPKVALCIAFPELGRKSHFTDRSNTTER